MPSEHLPTKFSSDALSCGVFGDAKTVATKPLMTACRFLSRFNRRSVESFQTARELIG